MGRLQTIIKRLREIEELKDRRSQGVQLKPAQLEKIGREQELRDEWDSLRSEGAAAAAAPAPSAIAAAPSACFQIFYRYDGRTKTLNDVHPSDTIMSLMLKIEKKDGLPPERQIVRYAAQPLSTDDTVADSNIQKGATLMITVRWTGSAKNEIYVRTLTGTPVTIKFTDDCEISTQTLLTVMNLIHRQLGVPVLMQRLIFAGKTLPTDRLSVERTLSHYNIQVGATLDLVQVSTYPAGRPITLTIIKQDGQLGSEYRKSEKAQPKFAFPLLVKEEERKEMKKHVLKETDVICSYPGCTIKNWHSPTETETVP